MYRGLIITVIVFLILIALGGFLIFDIGRGGSELSPEIIASPISSPTPTATITPSPATTTTSLVRITSPKPGDRVQSPLVIKGEARGQWFFEANFPVEIRDANGKILGEWYAEAKGDWMTTEFVPFESTLAFSPSTTATGTLVIMNANPSGDTERALELKIPITFNPQ
ncbi:Gmad2 immunoglobulin-like domain-containing protein [Candidatus Parcubacteria bacterium]|nr:Gmad2 immunoglobulin-like domain-containing protein [Candidatus Parcubacteria bacterium]